MIKINEFTGIVLLIILGLIGVIYGVKKGLIDGMIKKRYKTTQGVSEGNEALSKGLFTFLIGAIGGLFIILMMIKKLIECGYI